MNKKRAHTDTISVELYVGENRRILYQVRPNSVGWWKWRKVCSAIAYSVATLSADSGTGVRVEIGADIASACTMKNAKRLAVLVRLIRAGDPNAEKKSKKRREKEGKSKKKRGKRQSQVSTALPVSIWIYTELNYENIISEMYERTPRIVTLFKFLFHCDVLVDRKPLDCRRIDLAKTREHKEITLWEAIPYE